MNKIKEKFLINRTRKGDVEAFGEIYDEYIKKVYQFIFFRVPSKEIAQDLSHDVFVKLLDYIKNNDKEIHFLQALIYKIAKNSVADYYRHRGDEVNIDEVIYKLGEDIGLEQKIDIKIDVVKIGKQLNKLKNPEHREIIILKHLDELSHKEIAQVLDKSEKAVRAMLYRALKELKNIIKIEQQND